MEFGGFPKNLSYNIKTLSGFSKTSVKLTPDKGSGVVNMGDTIKVKLPSNTIVDLRTFSMFAKGSCSSAAGKSNVRFPRLTSSLIKTLAVYVNGTLIERIDNYNVLYNKLYDLDGGGVDQTAKRFLENADPSCDYTMTQSHTGGTLVNLVKATGPVIVDKKLMVNNWLGFISTCSCPCPDTNDLNEVIVEITFADEKVLWGAGSDATKSLAIDAAGAKWSLQDVHFTISKIVFNDPLYYNMKASKLLSSGLTLGYQTYISSKGASQAKGSSVNVLTTVNSTSLDQLICCLQNANVDINKLQLYGTNDLEAGKPFAEVYANPLAGQTNANHFDASAGGLYNQSIYFKSDASGLHSSSIEINNTPLMPQPLDDAEVYNETLIALGNLNQDMSSGVHPGCKSLADFLKFYFTHIVSLENIQQGDFYKSGLDGKASALNIAWKLVFSGSSASQYTPYIFAKTTRMCQINEGHSVTIIV
jgi:hypothetical protein